MRAYSASAACAVARVLRCGSSGGRPRLHQFDAVAEWIVDIDVVVACKWLIFVYDVAHAPQPRNKNRQALDKQRRVSLPGRAKVCFDAQVDLQIAPLEPASPALCEVRRFRNLRNFESTLVKLASSGLAPCRHGKLNVLESDYKHECATMQRRNP
jgi:hypothetical protein